MVAVITVVPPTETPPATEFALTSPRELGAGQHIAADGSYRATETEAAGPMVCRIERGSPAFRQLIDVYDARVLWSGGEPAPYGDEDHKMHPAMLEPFTALVDLVQQEWNGETQIMVTEIYDSLGDHDPFHGDNTQKYALHFEGRSIDLIPWPSDTARLARLCALTHAAGFDWVHNEADHCHASIKAQSLCELYDYRVGP